ncbi:cupin domain-containing protein [Streptomyces sp. NPDC056661]|uniref:cupin domain-containing protein n=1 Tax=Streptomyces sp. NPDC056661 TaxID=3345898 RepID=UPI0036A4FCB9
MARSCHRISPAPDHRAAFPRRHRRGPPAVSGSVPGQREAVRVLDGRLTFHEGAAVHGLNPGDSIEVDEPVPHVFADTSDAECRYAAILTRVEGRGISCIRPAHRYRARRSFCTNYKNLVTSRDRTFSLALPGVACDHNLRRTPQYPPSSQGDEHSRSVRALTGRPKGISAPPSVRRDRLGADQNERNALRQLACFCADQKARSPPVSGARAASPGRSTR